MGMSHIANDIWNDHIRDEFCEECAEKIIKEKIMENGD
jgi:hypothetical protein